MEFFANRFVFNKADSSFVQDVSSLVELRGRLMPTQITLVNRGKRTFDFVRTIHTGTGEDKELAGWVYQSREGGTITIFNT